MSKKKQEKGKPVNKNTAASKSTTGVADLWNEKKPILLFVLGFAVLMGVFYIFWFSEVFKVNVLEPVVRVNAVVASKVLNIFGFNTQTNGANLFSSAFTVDIKYGCDAIEPIAIYTFAVLLFPVSFRTKLSGLFGGVPLLWLLNQLRIISLFVFGIYSETLFEIMHVQVWQAVFIAITLIFLAYWIVWALRADRLKTATSA